ncbi:unnamed protein product [Parajaminaea phylloscopi]
MDPSTLESKREPKGGDRALEVRLSDVSRALFSQVMASSSSAFAAAMRQRSMNNVIGRAAANGSAGHSNEPPPVTATYLFFLSP